MQGGSIFTAALRDILACGQCDMFVCDERYRWLSFRICYEKPRSINASRFLQSSQVRASFHPQEGEPPATASGGNLAGGEVTGNEQSPQWGAATIDGAGARYSYAQLWAAGQAQQKIASKKVGEVAVTYSSGASSSSVSVQTDLADLTETDFGLQLLALLRLYGRSVYIP